MQWEKLIDGLVRKEPVGALMRIEEAAKELGLEVVDLLEYAQDRGDGGPVLRVCMATPDGLDVEPGLLAHLPMSITDPHARIYRVVLASRVPAFFDILARDGERTLGDEDRQSRIEAIRSKKSLLFATTLPDAAIRVRLKGLKVLREDVERLMGRGVAKRLESDPVEVWLDERCERSGWTDATTLFDDFAWWTQASGCKLLSSREFGKRMVYALGRDSKRKNSRSEYGVTLRIK